MARIKKGVTNMNITSNIIGQLQQLANQIQTNLRDTLRNSPASEIEKTARALISQGLQKMDLVTREEFELQSKVLEKTRTKLHILEAKLIELEKQEISPLTTRDETH